MIAAIWKSLAALAASALLWAAPGCSQSSNDSTPDAASGVIGCPVSPDVALTASANPVLDGPTLKVFGTASTGPGVTVRAIFVAGVDVPLTNFNFRGWSVDLNADLVTSLAHGAIAQIPVVAYTSDGCATLPSPLVVRVAVDGGASPQAQDAAADTLASEPDAGATDLIDGDAGDLGGDSASDR